MGRTPEVVGKPAILPAAGRPPGPGSPHSPAARAKGEDPAGDALLWWL